MRFENKLFLLTSLFGVATAYRRSCRPDLTNGGTGNGFYTIEKTDTWAGIAADFCTSVLDLQNMNPTTPTSTNLILTVPCKTRERDCARISGTNDGYYTVVEGDDLSSISSDFCIDNYGITLRNRGIYSSFDLHPGLVITVPCRWN
ncbi:putative Ecp7(P20) [Drepanopeziza brunnea f. sp. 'multigermtubi' MB_m1]|uniref:LysM08p n=2 Tax=Drepanopeziza brunnea f. sp. 'multigermtubi' TaxID=698441 RepID=J9XU58_9HELO|nr:putative Ecp7(P20) [Drepanopeziza brunnea f. sp. 'multigermtubi' MB_m1]AFS30726.1 LysM08p [Drepanopeziza brunnea f. sp. 'multigermtubi']EKD15024.1 putative Ecp7(P20) [Drepanopeziza brunnea f. sp. 'multigermtubi' MB_m1]